MTETHSLFSTMGIPDLATRITILIPLLFVLVIGIALVYFKMKESDEKAGI